MNLLLVDDEAGIRDGLAAYLRLRGHVVHTAGDVAHARAIAGAHRFDLLVSDWRLPDGTAADVLAAADCRKLVLSGYPDEVPADAAELVLGKPLLPKELAQHIETFAPLPAPAAAAALPADVAERLRLLAAWAGTAPQVDDDGVQVVLRVAPPAGGASALATLAPLGGDLRVVTQEGGTCVEWRLWRDGRPDGVADVVAYGGRWPADVEELAIDCGAGPTPTLAQWRELLVELAVARRAGRRIWLLNVPAHLRLWTEVSGTADDMPKRATPGPRLPAALAELWS